MTALPPCRTPTAAQHGALGKGRRVRGKRRSRSARQWRAIEFPAAARSGPRAKRHFACRNRPTCALRPCLVRCWPRQRAAPRRTGLVVGSKRFTESYVLGEIVAQTLAAAGRPASTGRASATPASSSRRSPAARSTSIPSTPGRSCASCSSAKAIPSLDELNRWLAPRGLVAAVPLGFNNTYALAMSEARAKSARHRAHLRPRAAAGARAAARPVARVPAARRRLAGAAPAYALPRDADRPRPRPGLRRARARARST